MTAKEQGFTLAEVAAFLDGSAPLDGVWFGEIHRELPGKFWWRKHLRAALAFDTGERGVILPESLVALARRCLHIAFVWNDHNFPAAHKMAREEATRWGIGSMDDANSWLDAPEEWPVSDALRAQPAGGGGLWVRDAEKDACSDGCCGGCAFTRAQEDALRCEHGGDALDNCATCPNETPPESGGQGEIVTDAEIAEWRSLRGEGMTSAVGEYTPREFWDALDEIERLRKAQGGGNER